MIEAAKELLEMVKHMPEYTLWVLLGILFYKVFIIGGWISVARLLINKIHHWATTPKPGPPPTQFAFGDYLIKDQVTDKDILHVFIKLKNKMGDPHLNYIFGRHILKMHELIDAMPQHDRTGRPIEEKKP